MRKKRPAINVKNCYEDFKPKCCIRPISNLLETREHLKELAVRLREQNSPQGCNDINLLLKKPVTKESILLEAQELEAYFDELIVDIVDATKYYESILSDASSLAKVARHYTTANKKYEDMLFEKGIDPLDITATVDQIESLVDEKAEELKRRKAALDEVEQEIAITQEMLAKKKSEMEIALRTRYTLTDSQKQTLLEEKDMILDGVEEWGSLYGALQHNPKIKSKQSTIQMYMQLFPEFGRAIAVSKALFKDRLEGIMIDRAIEGTENPVFSKGEHVGDYKIKDNKLFMELMKAKVPEQYNKKAVESVKNQQINNMNIISFANIDETKEGFTKDVGVVIDVDDTGKVKRIQQEKKMLEHYSKKPGVEIIEPEKGEEDDEL